MTKNTSSPWVKIGAVIFAAYLFQEYGPGLHREWIWGVAAVTLGLYTVAKQLDDDRAKEQASNERIWYAIHENQVEITRLKAKVYSLQLTRQRRDEGDTL